MKKLFAFLSAFVCAVLLVGCSADWTDKEIKNAKTVEITCYENGGDGANATYTISDERKVNNICNTFSLLVVKKAKITEPTALSYTIRFLDGTGKEIESVQLFFGYNVVNNDGRLYKITDEMDINRYIKEDVLGDVEDSSAASAYREIIEEYRALARLKAENGALSATKEELDGKNEIAKTVYDIVDECEDVTLLGYATKDIDKDGTPELVLINQDWYRIQALFTLRDGTPVLLHKFGKNGVIDYDGTVYSRSFGVGGLAVDTYVMHLVNGQLQGVHIGFEGTPEDGSYYKEEYGVRSAITYQEVVNFERDIEQVFWSPYLYNKESGFRFISALDGEAPKGTETADFSSYEKLLGLYRKAVRLAFSYERSDWIEGAVDDAYLFRDDESYELFNRIFRLADILYPSTRNSDWTKTAIDGGENAFGYALKDLNGDGTEEMIFLTDAYRVFAIFTEKDGVPVLLDSYDGYSDCHIDAHGVLRVEWYNDSMTQVGYIVSSITDEGKLEKDTHIIWDGHTHYLIDDEWRKTALPYEEGSRLGALCRADTEAYTVQAYNKTFSGLVFRPLFEAATPLMGNYPITDFVGVDHGTTVREEADGYAFLMQYLKAEYDPEIKQERVYEKDIEGVARLENGVYVFDNGCEKGRLEFAFRSLWVIIESSKDPEVEPKAYLYQYDGGA